MRITFRWFHFVAGITWIGMLYFFNLVNVPVQKGLDAETKKKVNPDLLGRAMWWFRMGRTGNRRSRLGLLRDVSSLRQTLTTRTHSAVATSIWDLSFWPG
jgi:hypothetical protein